MKHSITIAFLAPDCADPAVKKRANQFRENTENLVLFSFQRSRISILPNDYIALGKIKDTFGVMRIKAMIFAFIVLIKSRKQIKSCTLIYCRNLDLALLGIVIVRLINSRAKIVYEVLDIHPIVESGGLKGCIFSWLERLILKRCIALIISSNVFVSKYFLKRYQNIPKTILLENKYTPSHFPTPYRDAKVNAKRIVIGCFGKLRCAKSLEIILNLATEFPDKIAFKIAGSHAPELNELISKLQNFPNVTLEGAYDYDTDLNRLYHGIDLNWVFDFTPSLNAKLLLPNRIYEGGFFGVPALAQAGTETGNFVDRHGIGFVLDNPIQASLLHLLAEIDHQKCTEIRSQISALPKSLFAQEAGDFDLLDALMELPH